MIKLKCPGCDTEAKTVNVDLIFRVTNVIGMSGTSKGIETHTDRPIDFPRGALPTADQIGEYRCPHCGDASPSEDWKVVFYCSECGEPLVCPATFDNADEFAKAHVCDGGHGTKCYNCWIKIDQSYCSDCRHHNRCVAYAHFNEVRSSGGSPKQPVKARRRSIRDRIRREERVEAPVYNFDQPMTASVPRIHSDQSEGSQSAQPQAVRYDTGGGA